MANVKPFRGILPAPGLAPRTSALPYDVYSREEARIAVQGAPLSFLNIDRPETQFPPDMDMYAPEVYARAREMLDARIADGTYVQDEKACYYIYALTRNGRTQTGITACVSIDDYLNQVVKKHENTREDKELDRICHVDICSAQTGLIFLAFRADEALRGLMNREKQNPPLCDFVSEDGIRHAVWRIDSDESIAAVERAFAAMPAVYIADGHHRAASAIKVGLRRRAAHPDYDGTEEFNTFLSVLFPDDELYIMDYNRLVKTLNGHTPEEFLSLVEQVFTVEPVGARAVHPANKGEFGMLLDECWYRLTIKPEYTSEDAVEGLDVSLLQRHLLAPVLGIADPRTSREIEFVGGVRGTEELEKRCREDMRLGFSMHPTSIQELFAVADDNRLMPPKSTWFEPKLRCGLFIHRLEE